MKKVFGLLLAICAFLGLATPVVTHALDPNDFKISSFEADYYLSRTPEKASQLRVEEVIAAEFPNFDQNHGLLRAIPETYQDHPLNVQIEAITDASGASIKYETSHQNENIILKIGDPNTYVHGAQTYKITYTMQNVTQSLSDHDELYWDANGTQWQQPIQNVVARLHVASDIAPLLQERAQCFTGGQGGAGADCKVSREDNASTFTTTRLLSAGETLTFVAGFEKGTFAPYKMPIGTFLAVIAGVFFLGILPPVIAVIIAIRNWRRSGQDPKGKGTIVPEYLPPKETSVLMANAVRTEDFAPIAISATIIDLAVRHYIKVYERTEKKFLKNKTTYELELVRDTAGLKSEELGVITLLFGATPAVGSKKVLDVSDKSAQLHKDSQALGKSVTAQAAIEGYFVESPDKARLPYIGWGIALMIVGFFVIPYGIGLIVAGIILGIASVAMPKRTQKGVELRDYIKGLEMYMKLAEAERLKVLQSPHGALIEKINTGDNKTLVKLYEKLLPYAMLLGIEKDWAKQFAHLYSESPDWYVSNNATFNAMLFAGALHDFGAVTTNSFSAPQDSSSSGFGGGFAGGGGGGGGGGGW